VTAILADAILNIHRDHKREGEMSLMALNNILKWLWKAVGLIVLIGAILAVAVVIKYLTRPKPGSVKDEAMRAGRTVESLPGSDSDYLRAMDGGLNAENVHKALSFLSKEEAWKAYNRGRNNWVVWTAGNDTLWDFLANNTFGAFDLLKILSSHPGINYCGNKKPVYGYADDDKSNYDKTAYDKDADGKDAKAEYGKVAKTGYGKDKSSPAPYPPGYYVYDDDECQKEDRQFYEVSRHNRWKYLGLVNEPGFQQWDSKGCDWKNDKKTDKEPYGKCGDPDRFGLWLDKRVGPPDPFEDENRYPGVKIGARGKSVPLGSYYGYGSGIVGLRIFPNPDFDESAKKKWDPVRYYNDPYYYNDKNLVRPYRVGMSCGFCHVGPSPVKPPADPENPKWEELNSNPGAQYFWIDRIFFWNPKGRHENFIYQLFHTSLPGSLDTSLVSSDNINNPRTMNAVYSIAARLNMAKFHPEKLTGGERNNKQFNDYERTKMLSEYFQPPDTVLTAHVLKDGADSVGILGALNRVYINIGLFSEEWLLHFKPLLGNFPGKRITPIEIAVLEKNSTYWNANIAQTPDVALFFLASASPDLLKDAPGGNAYLTTDQNKLSRGKIVFAENCARCHSGKQPENLCPLGTKCEKDQIIENSAGYFEWMRKEVMKPDFLTDNFLSTERRVSVTELGTNACSPLATNGLGGDIWDNFTSTTYKELPAVGKFTVHHPKTGEPWEYEMPGDGRGYTRPASLISLWSTAPFLLNNSLGNFYGEPTVEARIASFNDSIQQMLWPEKRQKDSLLGDKVPGYMQRTTTDSYLRVAWGFLPGIFSRLMDLLSDWFPRIFTKNGLEIGPIPKGTPVALLANLPFVSEDRRLKERVDHLDKLVQLGKKAKKDLKALPKDATPEQKHAALANLIDPLLRLSKCPDYVVNRGHYFGTNLSDADKWALIEFLKTF
jgi:hypothetical protein